MSSVTGRIASVKQPYGGYIKPSDFRKISFTDEYTLNEDENVHASLIGMAVDYMTRYLMDDEASIEEAFAISLRGAAIAEDHGVKNAKKIASKLVKKCDALNDQAIINACKLVSFDVWVRNIAQAPLAKSYEEINPDKHTIENIRIMIERSVIFFEKYGPVTKYGFGFTPEGSDSLDFLKFLDKCLGHKKATFGGYTTVVESGDGDFLTKDTLWDYKVSKSKPTSKHTLQLLMYWIMGIHSGRKEFECINKLGIFNPRLNEVFLYDTENISKEIIQKVESEVICY